MDLIDNIFFSKCTTATATTLHMPPLGTFVSFMACKLA